MKKYLLIACSFLFCTSLFSQSEVYAADAAMSLGPLPALILDLNDMSEKKVKGYWSSYMNEYSKLKRNKKADELYAEGIRIPIIKATKIDFFSKIEKMTDSKSRLYVWIDLGGEFLSEKSDEKTFENGMKFMTDFANYAETKLVNEILEDAEGDLKGFEKDMKGLVKDKASYEKAIEDAKEKIMKNEKNIEKNIADQDKKTTEIENQMHEIIKIKERLASIGKKVKKD